MKVKTGPTYESNLENYAQQHIRSLGYDIECHAKLPGTPDITIPSRQVAVMVHGCFYHHHSAGCADSHVPVTRRSIWTQKFAKIKARDQRDVEQLIALGYRVIVIWGCALRRAPVERLLWALKTFIEGDVPQQELGNLDIGLLYAAAHSSGSVR